jgi:RNA polymerase sigma-70 factor (ECF subfamily)
MSLEPNEDNELAIAAQSGDRDAYAELVRRHQQRVYRLAHRLTGDREAAFDVTQDVFVKAYQSLNRWRPTGNFPSWLLRMAANAAIDHVRRRNRHRPDRLADEVKRRPRARHWLDSGDEGTAREVRRNEIDARVTVALEALSPAQRKVFVLRHYDGMALAEIASVLDSSEGSVKVHLFRALRKLRPLLADLMEDD